jgi:hypothetical protein
MLTDQRSGWHYLTREVRRQIESACPEPGRWDAVVLHGSTTARGGAAALAHYHRRVWGLADGLAYHFVIGNGSLSGDGEIEVGERWLKQVSSGERGPAGAVSPSAISICLIGDFNEAPATPGQIAALDELVDFLEAKSGELAVGVHRPDAQRTNGCPGRHFPEGIAERL